jgi:hypothetical protein
MNLVYSDWIFDSCLGRVKQLMLSQPHNRIKRKKKRKEEKEKEEKEEKREIMVATTCDDRSKEKATDCFSSVVLFLSLCDIYLVAFSFYG